MTVINALRYLAVATLALVLLLWSAAALADVPMFLALSWNKLMFWWTLPLAIAIEVAAIRWIFEFTWQRALRAALLVNVVTFLLGFLLYPQLGVWLFPVLAPLVVGTIGGGQLVDLGVTLAMFALVDTAIELPLLRYIFKAGVTLKKALLFLLANALTGAIFFAVLVVPSLPDRIPPEEVSMLEEYYAPEIQYMRALFDEMPENVTETDEKYVYYAFDQDWADEKRAEVAAYRFYELMAGSPVDSDPLTPKVNRFERSRNYDAQYSKGNLIIKGGLYDDELKIYAYKISRTINGDEYFILAIFEAPD